MTDDVELQPEHEDPRIVPAINLLQRTGARGVQIRFSDDEEPVVWMAVVEYVVGDDGRPLPPPAEGRYAWDTAAGRHPLEALMRLCDERVGGAMCVHCERPTAFSAEPDPGIRITTPGQTGETFCWYAWDPELRTFRRSCEGDTPPRPNRATRRALGL